MSPARPKRVAIYARVSTDQQTAENQVTALHEVAERHGWNVADLATWPPPALRGTDPPERAVTGGKIAATRQPTEPPMSR